MIIERNYEDVKEGGEGFQVIPEDRICMFEIIQVKDGYSSNSDVMIQIVLECIEEGSFCRNKIYDNILLPTPDSKSFKIAGRSKRFLHAIDEPFQGSPIIINTDNWLNKTTLIKVGVELTKGGKYDGKPKNTVKAYVLLDEIKSGQSVAKISNTDNNARPSPKNDDLPF
jgi:hypothetical protein